MSWKQKKTRTFVAHRKIDLLFFSSFSLSFFSVLLFCSLALALYIFRWIIYVNLKRSVSNFHVSAYSSSFGFCVYEKRAIRKRTVQKIFVCIFFVLFMLRTPLNRPENFFILDGNIIDLKTKKLFTLFQWIFFGSIFYTRTPCRMLTWKRLLINFTLRICFANFSINHRLFLSSASDSKLAKDTHLSQDQPKFSLDQIKRLRGEIMRRRHSRNWLIGIFAFIGSDSSNLFAKSTEKIFEY